MKYTVLLFDADNTLFDYDIAEFTALENTFTAFAIKFTPAVQNTYKQINDQLWLDLEAGLVTKDALKVIRFTQTLAELGITADAEAMSRRYTTELGKGTQLLDGAKDFVATIAAKQPLYILTNGIHEVQESRIGNSAIAPYIAKVYTSEGIGFTKPHVGFFEHVFADLGCEDMSEVIMVGDSLSADIQGATNAGITSCWFNPKKLLNTTGIQPTYEVSTFTELLALLV